MLLSPLSVALVSAGFPSPAEDWKEDDLDLNRFLVKRPTSTFYVRVKGDSMMQAGIFEGDVLIVDRAIKPANRQVVIAIVNAEFTVKRLQKEGDVLRLLPENPNYPPIEINSEMDFQIWGVVTACIHKF